MIPVQHSGALEGSEWLARHHHQLCQGGGTEDTEFGRRGYAGERKEGLSGLQYDSRNGHGVKIPEACLDGGG